MPTGPGVYDDMCTLVREVTHAQTTIVIVFKGKRGSGFSVQTVDPAMARQVPFLLRDIANEIEITNEANHANN